MSSADPKENATATAIAEVAKSKAGEKLMDAVKGLVQLPTHRGSLRGQSASAKLTAARAGGKAHRGARQPPRSSACGQKLLPSFSTGRCTKL